jgi:hypothetical protein
MSAYKTQEIEAALLYAQSQRVSRVWGQATGQWLYTFYHGAKTAGADYTNRGPYDYHSAICNRRADVIACALEELGFSEEECLVVGCEEIAGLSNVRAMRKMIRQIETSYHAVAP